MKEKIQKNSKKQRKNINKSLSYNTPLLSCKQHYANKF